MTDKKFNMSNFQKIILILLVIALTVGLYFWRQDIKYKRCLELLRLGAGQIEQFKTGNCPAILRNNMSQ